ncbi:CHRD domain-containing protein [Fodinibius roseus]|uniref:CHRD domain-containing protein n=1 Tax=Fodinibius roseus TaxID=1194090 RepID=A0A1M5HWC3_9BACT|nr:CHRD domain-containing protein [Fodinibius roseus]SHG20245.1 CHRD domain-containing protein [Fodinibius roseus]
MKLKNTLCALFVLLLLSVTLDPQPAYAQQARQIMLAGYNHEPPVSTPGTGLVIVSFKQDTLRVKGDFSDLTSPYRGAYVMIGEKEESGNMLFRLNVEPSEDRTGGEIKARDNAFFLNDAQKPLLKKGELYINITTSNHTSGELRGQIPPMK